MRAITLICFATAVLLNGCLKSEGPAMLTSAESFAKSMVNQLGLSGTIDEWGGSSGQAGNVFTKDFSRLLAAEGFSPERLYDAGNVALVKWGGYDTYSSRGSGGGGNHFRLHFGNGRSHAFVDVVAYAERDKTRVDFQIRVVE